MPNPAVPTSWLDDAEAAVWRYTVDPLIRSDKPQSPVDAGGVENLVHPTGSGIADLGKYLSPFGLSAPKPAPVEPVSQPAPTSGLGDLNAYLGMLGITAPSTPPSAPAPSGAATAAPAAMPTASAPTSAPTGPAPAAGGDLRAYARSVAQQYGVDPGIFERQINQESGFNPSAVSNAGARGIAQFMPGTAASYGVDVNDPYSSLEGAARHMRDNLAKYGGDYRLALAAYNAGQGNVDKYGEGVFGADFANGQTRDYVDIILGPGGQPRTSQSAPQAATATTTATAQSSSAPVTSGGSTSGPTVTYRDQWGNVFTVPKADFDKRPGGTSDLTVVGTSSSGQSGTSATSSPSQTPVTVPHAPTVMSGTDISAGPDLMLRQPLQPMPGDAYPQTDASTPGASESPPQSPPWEQQPTPAAPGAGAFQDDQTQNGQVSPYGDQTAAVPGVGAPSREPPDGTGSGMAPVSASAGPGYSTVASPAGLDSGAPVQRAGMGAVAPASQQIPNEDPTSYPRPEYVPPASPLVTAPPDAGLTPPPSPYDQQQAASMEPDPNRFQNGGEQITPSVVQHVLGPIQSGVSESMTPGNSLLDFPSQQIAGTNADERALQGLPEAVRGPILAARRAGFSIMAGEMTGNIANAYWTEAGFPNIDIAGFEINPGQFLVPGNFNLGGGYAPGMVRAGATPFGTGVAGAIERGAEAAISAGRGVLQRGVGAIGDRLTAGAERAAALDAERAAAGGATSAYGTLGVVPPSEGGSTIRRGGAPMEKPPVWTTPNTTVFDPGYPTPGLLESTGIPPESPQRASPDQYVYHLTSPDALPGVAQEGLGARVGDRRGAGTGEVFLADGSRATRKPGLYVADNAGILSTVDRDVYGSSDWALLRFKRGGRRWARDPEFGPDSPGAWITRQSVDPSEIEVFTGDAWRPVSEAFAPRGEPPGGQPPRSTTTYGVFGVAPPEAGPAAEAVARPRWVPPDVRMQTTPNMEIPNDPRLQQAVEAVGGRIDPERGILVHITRAQDEAAAGGLATRGGVFTEAVKPGGRSSYAQDRPSAGGVGGNQVIEPRETAYRKPIVLDSEPGSAQGFDQAMARLVPSSSEMESLIQQRVAAYQELQSARTTGRTGNINRAQAAVDALNERISTLHPTNAAIDQGIRQARRAGPEGSPARAAALKELVSRYGGDPSLIDDLLKIRGADHSESTWAIKENIVSTNARRQGYDGVFTLENKEPTWAEISKHPSMQPFNLALEDAAARLDAADQAIQRYGVRYFNDHPEIKGMAVYETPEYKQLQRESHAAGQARNAARDAMLAQGDKIKGDLPSSKIKEILDVQQSHNPTPGAPHPHTYIAVPHPTKSGAWAITPAGSQPMPTAAAHTSRQAAEAMARSANAGRTLPSGAPGYTLHPDVAARVRPTADAGSTTASSTAGITPVPMRLHTDVLASVNKALSQGVASAVSGGVGAATNQQLNPDDPNAALKGFAVGAVAPYAISRGAGALARRAGREAGQAEGVLGVLGIGGRPKAQAAANAADPIVRNVGRQMEGDYRVRPTPDPRTVGQRLADAFATAWTDNRAGLYRLQNSVSEAIGRPLKPDEMVAELSRLNPASTASQRLEENLGPILQKVGEDQDWLAQYLVHSHNIDVAREMGQRTYDAAIAAGRSPIVASRQAVLAANTRQFSGDLNLAQTQQALQTIESTVKGFPDGAARWQAIVDGAQSVWGHNRETLQRKLDAGMIAQDMFNELTQRYPRYVRTDIADYFERGSGAAKPAGRTIGTSDIGIQKLDPRGTGKDRVNPLLSTIDQTYTAESAIQRNDAGQAFEKLVDADPTWASTFREVVPRQGVNVGDPGTTVPGTYKLRGKEQFLTVWDGGDSRTFVIPGEFASLVGPQGGRILGDSALANGWRSAMNIYKGLITSKNPAFSLLVSPIRDAGDYVIREATISGNAAKIPPRTVTRTTAAGNTVTLTQSTPGVINAARSAGAAILSLPRVVSDYVKAVPAAFDGIVQGQFRGDLAAMMKAGAGQMSRPGHTNAELRQSLRELSRQGGLQINDLGDLRHVLGNVVTLGAEPLGNRLEQVPRLAAARRAAQRGASTTGQAMAFRDATVDFQRGGDIAKALNAAVPFLNTTIQGGAQVARTAKQNPAAFVASIAATIGLATAGSEAWNNADPQRAADYKDVPDYLKKTGIVFMLPGVTGSDQRGDRRPNFAWIPTGNYGAFVAAARDAIQKTGTGEVGADLSTLSGWGSLAADVGGTFSPLRGDSAGSALTSLIPPPLSTAADLVGNKDLYRGSTIATDRNDQNASAMAQASAAGFNRVTGKETRSSQWDYLYRDLGGFAAGALGEASNMAAETAGLRPRQQEQRPIQDFPVAGGIAGRVVRDSVGQELQTAQDEQNRVPAGIRPLLQEAGVRRDEITAVPSTLQNIPLTREEQARWQERTNVYIEREVTAASRSPEWRKRGADQSQLVKDAVTRARQRAEDDVLRRIPASQQQRRIRESEMHKAS